MVPQFLWGDDPEPIVVPHITKTAGTSLREYLTQVYGPRLIVEYPYIPLPTPSRTRRLARRLGSARAELPPRIGALMGHFPATKYERALPTARYAVWLRDPVDRLLSHYHYYRRNPQWAPKRWRDAPLMDFLADDRHQNAQARYLDGKPLADFAFVAVTEFFEESLVEFARTFGLPTPARAPRTNVNPNRSTPHYEVSPEVRDFILSRNSLDVALYAMASARWEGGRISGSIQSADGLPPSAG